MKTCPYCYFLLTEEDVYFENHIDSPDPPRTEDKCYIVLRCFNCGHEQEKEVTRQIHSNYEAFEIITK